MYDWGITSFSVIVTTFVIATYFTSQIAVNDIVGTHQWGNTMAIAGIIVAICSPIFGAIADYSGRRQYWLGVFTVGTIISAALLWYAYPKPTYVFYTLACVMIGTVTLNLSMVFYNALLPRLSPKRYMGRISGWGWGTGYFGGLIVLIIAFYGFVHANLTWLDLKTFAQIRICGPLVAVWTVLFTLPLFFILPQENLSGISLSKAIRHGLKDLVSTIKMMPRQKTIFIFLIAQMIYIDGLNTIFAFAGIYAAGTFHMSLSEVLLFGIVMNAFAGLGAILLAWVDDWLGAKCNILLSLILLLSLGLAIVLVTTKSSFWILASLLSLFVGPVQASSRSLMAHLVPKEKATEFFGFYVLSGKISTFVGPWLLGFMTLSFHSQRVGMGSVLSFFLLGAIILCFVRTKPTAHGNSSALVA